MSGDALRPTGTVFVPGATEKQSREIQEAVLLPEGSLLFRLEADALYQQAGEFTVLEIPSGAALIWVTRDGEHVLRFVHATPGTGTRIASVRLPERVEGSRLLVTLTWSVSATAAYVGFPGHELVQGDGVVGRPEVRVAKDGVFLIGDTGMEVAGYHVFGNGKLIVRESALEAWKSTAVALDIHMRGQAAEGYVGEVVQANLALVMLATGFETYCGRRFSELPDEGRKADVQRFAQAFPGARENAGSPPASVRDVLDRVPIDFGNLKACSRAFRSAYGIRFGVDLGVPSTTLDGVRRMLEYRHRIVHVSPLIGFLNQPHVPPEKPVFSGRGVVTELAQSTEQIVQALHEATLRVS